MGTLNDINILENAPRLFKEILEKIEASTTADERAKLASDYLQEHEQYAIKSIDYPALGSCLCNPTSCPPSVWRRLYVLERSIPVRRNEDLNKYSWIERLAIFYDTYLLEHSIRGKKFTCADKTYKMYFTKDSGDHEHLKYGPGNFKPDFYFWQVDAGKANRQGHAVFAECKHWNSPNAKAAYDFYADSRYRYNAPYVIIFTSDHNYYLANYEQKTLSEITGLEAPTNFINW